MAPLLAVLLSAAVCVAPPGDPPAGTPEGVDEFLARGDRLLADKDWGGALWNFREADRLSPTPLVARRLAQAYRGAGEDAMAAYYLHLYLRRDPQVVDSLEVAEELADLLSGPASDGKGLLEIDATGNATVSVDGRDYPGLPVAAFVPAGEHELRAVFSTGPLTRKVVVRAGKTAALTLEPPAPPATAVALMEKTTVRRPSLQVVSLVLLGTSAAALLAGTYFGLASRADTDRVTLRPALIPFSEAQKVADSANRNGTLANLSFGIGAAAGLCGGLLLGYSLSPHVFRGPAQ